MKKTVKRILAVVLCISLLCGMIIIGDATYDRTLADNPLSTDTVNPYNKAWIGEYPDENTSLKTNLGEDVGSKNNPFIVLEIVPELNQAQAGYFFPGCEPIDMAVAVEDKDNVNGYLGVLNNFTIDSGKNPCKIKNNDTFVQNVFGKSSYGSDGFVSNVVTVTPADLGAHLNLIQEADLIYFHDGEYQTTLRDCWYKYNADESLRSETPGEKVTFGDDNDITNQTAINIMKRMAGDDSPALVFDGTKLGYTDEHQIYNNIPKLKLMATMFKPEDFVTNLNLLDAIESYSDGEDKLYYPVKNRNANGKLDLDKNGNATDNETASLNWSIVHNINNAKQAGTFAYDPSGQEVITDHIRYSGGSFSSNNVFDKIFCYDGSNILFSQMLDSSQKVNFNTSPDPLHGGAYNQDLVDFYKQKDSKKKDYTPLDIMKYILSVQQYKPFLSVLEIQPCQNFIYGNKDFVMKDDKGKYQNTINGRPAWEKYYEGLFPWYDSSQDSEESWVSDPTRLKVTTMTTAEFIGSTGRYEYGQTDEYGRPVTLTYESSDDLIAKYDLIIFGAWQDASNGAEGYNDPLLNNDNGSLKYTAVGDLVYRFDDPGYSTKVSTDHTKLRDRVRYSGTDITLKKMLELQDFLRAGKPIVVDEDLYKKQGNKYEVDTDKVDKSSKLYDLLQWKDENSKYIYRYGSYSGEEMQNVLAKSKCHLVFASDSESYPLEYSYSQKDASFGEGSYKGTATGVIENENYQAKDADGKATLKFHFYVSGVAGRKYQVRLNLDVDGDGVFRGSLKQHSEIDNMNEAMGYDEDEKEDYNTAEIPLALTLYDSNEKELGNSSEVLLEEGQYYYATYELPKSRLGIVPWKLEVNDYENTCIRSSAVDYTAFSKNDAGDKAKINVLQMCLPHSGLTNWNNDGITRNFIAFTTTSVNLGGHNYYDPDYEYTSHDDSRIFNRLPSTGAKITAKKFETYLDPVDEFDVHIQFLYNSDWNKMFGSGAKHKDGHTLTKAERLEAWMEFLSEYDMIVLGFEDENAFTSSEVFTKGFDDFINQGKGVILSHDTVEGANANRNYYGKYAPWLRTVSGQRRAFYNKVEKNGKITYEKSYLTTYTNATIIDDPSGVEEYKKYTRDKRNLAYRVNNGQLNGYISPDLLRDTQWGHYFTPDIDLTSVEEEFLDGSYFVKENLDNAAQLYANYAYDSSRKDKVDRVIKDGNKYNTGWPDVNAGTSIVKLTNNGQITTYPYLISPYITVANTHCQNYQLDLEYQVGGDVNVWFNLTDFADPGLKTQTNQFVTDEVNGKTSLSKKWTRIYSSKDQDSRNNFYIYNKGNITYTGSGHGTSQQALTDDEVKLFVNTMISAYRPPEEGPTVEIVNASSASSKENLLYVDYDTERDSTSDNVDKDILDGNIVTDASGTKMVKVQFMLPDDTVVVEDGSGEGSKINKTYYLSITDGDNNKVLKSRIVPPSGVESPEEISNSDYMKGYVANQIYTMYIPYDELAEKGQMDFTFNTYCKYKKKYNLTERTMRTPRNITKLSVLVLPLFDLN